jgi:hypothetical protein
MRNCLLILFSLIFLSACDPWKNSENAEMKDQVKLNGYYYSYYVQSMWDGNLEFIVKTEYNPSQSIKSPNGEIDLSKELVLHRSSADYRSFIEGQLRVENNIVKICRNSNCEIIKN